MTLEEIRNYALGFRTSSSHDGDSYRLWNIIAEICDQVAKNKGEKEESTSLPPGIWHYSVSPGVRLCGNDGPNSSSTQRIENVTCRDCLQWISNIVREYHLPKESSPPQRTAGEVAAEKYIEFAADGFAQIKVGETCCNIAWGGEYYRTSENINQRRKCAFLDVIAAIIDAERANEREACAKVADSTADESKPLSYNYACRDILRDIRSRK